jgi:predicted transcriptional regulator
MATVNISPSVKQRLQAASEVTGRPQCEIADEALEAWLAGQRPANGKHAKEEGGKTWHLLSPQTV